MFLKCLIFEKSMFGLLMYKHKDYPMHNSELKLHLNCAFDSPCFLHMEYICFCIYIVYTYMQYIYIYICICIYDAFQKNLHSCKLIRSPSNLARRKNINFESVPRSSRKLPEASRKLSQRLSQKGKKTRKVDMMAALEAPVSFLETFRNFMN